MQSKSRASGFQTLNFKRRIGNALYVSTETEYALIGRVVSVIS